MPAEWENPSRILLTLPAAHTDWGDILPEALDQYRRLIEALVAGVESLLLIAESLPQEIADIIAGADVKVLDIPYNDTWTRDYGPITVEEQDKLLELDFGFNGWGLKFAADRDNLINLQLAEISENVYRNNRDFVLEGGSIESDGRGLILTTSRCLCSPNRNGGKSRGELESILAERLGAKKVLWLDHGFLEGDDTDSHVDTLARIAPDDTILYVAPPEDSKDIHYEDLKKMEEQLRGFTTPEDKPLRLVALPFPDPIYDEDGQRLPATYANYLVTGSNLYLPTYSQEEKDRQAEEAVRKVFPHHRIFTIDCRTLIRQHGSLHCSTIQLYNA